MSWQDISIMGAWVFMTTAILILNARLSTLERRQHELLDVVSRLANIVQVTEVRHGR